MLFKRADWNGRLYVDLQKELESRPNDPRLIQAMINHYQMKIDVRTA
jgi:hypothetical protein